MEWFRERVRRSTWRMRPPEPLLKGRDLLALGLAPGPRVGRILQAVYEMQLDGARHDARGGARGSGPPDRRRKSTRADASEMHEM